MPDYPPKMKVPIRLDLGASFPTPAPALDMQSAGFWKAGNIKARVEYSS